jgi:hypothetical protein
MAVKRSLLRWENINYKRLDMKFSENYLDIRGLKASGQFRIGPLRNEKLSDL